MMSATIDSTLVAEVARAAVTRVAPHELPLFRATAAAYFKRADQVSHQRQNDDDMLGFGGVVDVSMVTPVALAVASAVVQLVATELAKSMGKRTGDALVDRVAGAFKGPRRLESPQFATDQAPALTPAQLERVRVVAIDKALRLRLPKSQADRLADAVISTLALPAS
jgi:hypothetical protein